MSKYIFALTTASLLIAFLASAGAQQPNMPSNMFTASGFVVRYADTPDRRAILRSLPPDKLVTRTKAGKTYFVYADPTGCNCAYVGTPRAYRAYQTGSFEPLPEANGAPAVTNADRMLDTLGDMNDIAPGIEDLFGPGYE